MPTLCLLGIDTGIGKSIVTGLLAGQLLDAGNRVITQKLVQTGCAGRPEDILVHRRLMKSGWLQEDEDGLTCPYCLAFAGSPHLAAELESRTIDPDRITAATRRLQSEYEWVIIEGAGGLLVPLTPTLTQLDYVGQHAYHVILVTSSRLGSINHTLLSLEAMQNRGLRIAGLVYNTYGSAPDAIRQDSLKLFAGALASVGQPANIIVLPPWPSPEPVNWQPFITELA